VIVGAAGVTRTVIQDTLLFNDTVRYNIQYGNINASEDEVIAAARRSVFVGVCC
jgi:ABC-type multidrug transport system fused ATPase/permease subunit